MEVLIDTNIILDIALQRSKFAKQSGDFLKFVSHKDYRSFLTATTITDIYYVLKKSKGHQRTIDFIGNLILFVDVAGVTKNIVMSALTSKSPDFEDAIQAETAKDHNIKIIVTRNTSDFINTGIKAVTPQDFVKQY